MCIRDSHVDVRRVNAQDLFLNKLAGVTEPERKRKIIGEEFIRVFEAEAKKISKVDFLAPLLQSITADYQNLFSKFFVIQYRHPTEFFSSILKAAQR